MFEAAMNKRYSSNSKSMWATYEMEQIKIFLGDGYSNKNFPFYLR